jgi:hypothetical protein
MRAYKTFAEYLAQRDSVEPPRPVPGFPPVDERSLMGGVFRAVNPARPTSPTNSRLLAGPHPKRLKSQVIGR